MILVIIICGILYLFMIYGVIYLYYTYHKDYEELENRLLQNEKRINGCINAVNELIKRSNFLEWCHIPDTDQLLRILNHYGSKDKKNNTDKEGEDNMACKKGRGGRKK